MAYPSAVVSVNGTSSAVLNYSADEDDYMFIVSTRQYDFSTPTTPSGWTKETYNTNGSNNCASHIWSRRATSSEPTSVTIGAGNSSHDATLYIIKGVDTTTAYDVSFVSRASGNSTQPQSPSITPTNANTLIFMICVQMRRNLIPEPGLIKFARTGGAGAGANAYYTYGQGASTAVTAHDWIWERDENLNPAIVVFALRDNGDDHRFGYVPKDSPPADIVSIMGASGGYTGYLTDTRNINIASTVTTLDGQTTSHRQSDGANQEFEVGFAAFGYRANNPANDFSINCHSRTPSIDLENEIISFSTLGDPDMYLPYADQGKFFGIGDASNFRIWKVDALDTKPSGSEGAFPIAIEVDGGFENTEVGTVNSTLLQAITHIMMAGPSDSPYEENGVGFLYILNTMEIVGGSTTFPANFDTGVVMARTSSLRTVSNQSQQATNQFFCTQAVSAGDGAIETYWDSSGSSVEFVGAYDEDEKRVQGQISENKIGFIVNASDDCTINISNMQFSMGNFQFWKFESGTSTSATYTESGTTIISATPTLEDIGRAIAGMTFSGCKELTKNSADMSGGNTIESCVDTNAITITGATQAAIQSDIDDLANCNFTSNNVAIRIEYTGTGDITLSFDAITWTSNTTDIHYNATNTSALTANMNNGANASTSAVSGSATTVTINNTITVKVTVKDADDSSNIQNARVFLKADTGGDLAAGTVILNGLSNASGIVQDTGFNFTNNQPVTGWVRKTTSGTLYKQGLLGGTIVISGYDVNVFLVAE